MTPNPIRFGTDGWRAVVADDFTYANVRAVAQGVAAYLGTEPRPVVVGHDFALLRRACSRARSRASSSPTGMRVVLLDRVTPTPAVSWTITQQHAAGGVVVTASHNSAEFNGIKYKPDFGGSAPPEIVAEIERHTAAALETGVTEMTYDEAVATGRLQIDRPAPGLLRAARQDGRPRRAPRPWPARAPRGHVRRRRRAHRPSARRRLDHRRGVARRAQPGLRRHASRADRSLHAGGDGAHGSPARSTSASPTTATRIVWASSTRPGRYINQLQVMALFAMYLLEKRGLRGDIVRSITTSGMLDALGERFGVTVHEMPVGFKYIGTKMMETDAHPRRRGVRWLRVPRPHPRARRHPLRADDGRR